MLKITLDKTFYLYNHDGFNDVKLRDLLNKWYINKYENSLNWNKFLTLSFRT
jgi:hypothetical protein